MFNLNIPFRQNVTGYCTTRCSVRGYHIDMVLSVDPLRSVHYISSDIPGGTLAKSFAVKVELQEFRSTALLSTLYIVEYCYY